MLTYLALALNKLTLTYLTCEIAHKVEGHTLVKLSKDVTSEGEHLELCH